MLVLLCAFAFLVYLCLRLADQAKDAPSQRRARIAVLVVAIIVLAWWLFGPWPFPLPRLRG